MPGKPRIRDSRNRIIRRSYTYSSLHPLIREKIEADERKWRRIFGYGDYKSWIVELGMATLYGLDIVESPKTKLKLVKRKKAS